MKHSRFAAVRRLGAGMSIFDGGYSSAGTGGARRVSPIGHLVKKGNMMRRRAFLAAAAASLTAVACLPLATRGLAAGMGDYDANHNWHDANWWFRNNPDWVYQHHPEWIRANPSWRQEGDWDAQHHWHSRQWWVANNKDWVKHNHPDWH